MAILWGFGCIIFGLMALAWPLDETGDIPTWLGLAGIGWFVIGLFCLFMTDIAKEEAKRQRKH